MRDRPLRLFIAVSLPEAMKGLLSDLQASWKKKAEGVRWVRPEGLHLTLKFLGDVPSCKVEAIGKVMEEVARSFPPFEVEVRGAGAFPNLRRPRVLWVGVSDPEGRLKGLFKALEKGLRKLGFPEEERDFHPHLTLGRVKAGGDFSFLQGEEVHVGVLPVREVVLFKSELRPEGALYHALFSAPLGGVP